MTTVYEDLFTAPLSIAMRDLISLLISANGMSSDRLSHHLYGDNSIRHRHITTVRVAQCRKRMEEYGWTILSETPKGGQGNFTVFRVAPLHPPIATAAEIGYDAASNGETP